MENGTAQNQKEKTNKEELLNRKEIELKALERELLNEKDVLVKREEALSNREDIIKKIQCFKEDICKKQRLLIVPSMLILFVIILIICVIGIMFESEPCLGMGKEERILQIVNSLVVKKGISATILLMILLFDIYGIYIVNKSLRRYKNAINKLNILIMRLELYTDKDLLISSRLDRELEMIYRILES